MRHPFGCGPATSTTKAVCEKGQEMPSAFLGANGRSSGILSEGTPSCLDVYINVRVLSNVKILRSHSVCQPLRVLIKDSCLGIHTA